MSFVEKMGWGKLTDTRAGVVAGAAGLWALTHRLEKRRNTSARSRKHGVGTTVLAGTFAGAVALLIAAKTGKRFDVGLTALKTSALLARGKSGIAGTALRMASDVKMFENPIFKKIVGSGDNVALAAGLMSIPISHRFVQRAISKWIHHNDMHYRAAYLPSEINTTQGDDLKRKGPSSQAVPSNIGAANVNVRGTIKSHYNAKAAQKHVSRKR